MLEHDYLIAFKQFLIQKMYPEARRRNRQQISSWYNSYWSLENVGVVGVRYTKSEMVAIDQQNCIYVPHAKNDH